MSNTLTSTPAGHWPARRSIISAQLQTQFGMDQGLSIEQCLAGSGLTLSQLGDPASEIAASQELILIGNLVAALGHIPDLGLLGGPGGAGRGRPGAGGPAGPPPPRAPAIPNTTVSSRCSARRKIVSCWPSNSSTCPCPAPTPRWRTTDRK